VGGKVSREAKTEDLIRDNIIHGNEGASETEIAKVSREANIHQFVSNLPDGYDRRAACFRVDKSKG
jgi:ABC-type multidrug transport system fused ATPase/permease subunit